MTKNSSKISNIEKIQELRQQASYLLTLNNAIVDEVWKIERQLQNASEVYNQKLQEQKNALIGVLEKEEYDKEIESLKNQIYELEIKEFGQSDILSSSPKPGAGLL